VCTRVCLQHRQATKRHCAYLRVVPTAITPLGHPLTVHATIHTHNSAPLLAVSQRCTVRAARGTPTGYLQGVCLVQNVASPIQLKVLALHNSAVNTSLAGKQ
jgi:hypothetical protein